MMDEGFGRRLFGRVQSMVARGVVTAVAIDDGVIQTVQVRLQPDGAVRDGCRVMSFMGFSSSPPLGSDVLLLFMGGDRSNGVIIGTNNKAARFKGLKGGEAAFHDANAGLSIHLSQGGIVINAGGKPMTFQGASAYSFDAPITCAGQITAGYGTSDQVTVLQHRHPANGSPPTPGT